MKNKVPVIITALVILVIASVFLIKQQGNKIPEDNFNAPGKEWVSPKKVEDYFIDRMKAKPEEATEMAKNGVEFRVSKDTTLQGIVGNLAYYGLVRDEKALLYALENTKDTTAGTEGAIEVGTNGTIDTESTYELATNMSTWDVANILLNKPIHWGDSTRYDYLFMPGNPNAPRETRPSK